MLRFRCNFLVTEHRNIPIKSQNVLASLKKCVYVCILSFVIVLSFVHFLTGPRWGTDSPEEKLLARAVRNSLKLANDLNCRSIALPAISCGIFGSISTLAKSTTSIKKAIFETTMGNELENIEVVRLVSLNEDVLKKF